ncbi:MAG: DeoR/GlpR family DNA-binding transcription regulator [Thermaerobacter sp.]|nr:DeoR/GlpR family DNA-binding transcription regulator [Thermaerobacter sp.]
MNVPESADVAFLPKERLVRIFEMIERQGSARVSDLARQFGTSLMTIRRDLTELEQKGVVVRTRGGVMLRKGILEDYEVDVRRRTHLEQKQAIARTAAGLIKSGDTIALDASTTVVELARLLVQLPLTDVTVVTNNFMVANVIATSSIDLFFVGGRLRREALSTVGSQAQTMLAQWACAKTFVSGTGVDLEVGLMDSNPDEVGMKQLMLRNSVHRYLLADSSKLMRRAVMRVCPLTDFDAVITDAGIDAAVRGIFESSDIPLTVAD